MGVQKTGTKAKGLTRRCIISSIGVLGLGGLAYLLSRERPSFQDAQKDAGVRPSYVAYWQKQFQHLGHIGGITYSTNEAPRDHAGMATNFVVGTIGDRIKQPITVFKGAFEYASIKSESDFLSVLVDHEIDGHAKIFYEGSPEFKEDEFLIEGSQTAYDRNVEEDVIELYAYENQWKKRQERNISPEMAQTTLQQLWKNYSDLIHPVRNNAIANKASLEKFRKRFFLSEFEYMRISVNGKSGPVMLPNNQMMTVFGPVDLPSYLRK